MTETRPLRFGFTVAPVGDPGATDLDLYRDARCDFGRGVELGFDSVWTFEHHFSDYFPIPSPLLFLAHLAALRPGVDLGTSVIVTPWHDPLRLAEEIAMLSVLCTGELHLGIGRGTAKMEYDAFGVRMEEARGRLGEGLVLVREALRGAPFTHHGTYYDVGREVALRPTPDARRIHFYGAIGSPESAAFVGEMGLPPLSISNFPIALQRSIMTRWKEGCGSDAAALTDRRPLVVGCFLGDTEEEARRLARQYVPPFFALQARHYEVDADHWRGIEGYQQFTRMFANLKRLSNPANLDPYLDLQLVGTPDTALERIAEYRTLGFDFFVIHVAISGMPQALRHEMLERFARDVVPYCGQAPG